MRKAMGTCRIVELGLAYVRYVNHLGDDRAGICNQMGRSTYAGHCCIHAAVAAKPNSCSNHCNPHSELVSRTQGPAYADERRVVEMTGVDRATTSGVAGAAQRGDVGR
jgi:hypothetical protein